MESESISQEFQISERKQRKGNKGEERSRGGGHTDLLQHAAYSRVCTRAIARGAKVSRAVP